jgi:hypothetical protein
MQGEAAHDWARRAYNGIPAATAARRSSTSGLAVQRGRLCRAEQRTDKDGVKQKVEHCGRPEQAKSTFLLFKQAEIAEG